MNQEVMNRKQQLLKKVSSMLSAKLDRKRAADARQYVSHCFRRVPLEEIESVPVETLVAVISSQLDFIKYRKPGETLVRVFNPTSDKDGWESNFTIVEMVNDDMPFLVDTAALTVSEMGLGMALVVHPVIRIERDKAGRMVSVRKKDDSTGAVESVIRLHVDRHTDKDMLEEIRNQLVAAMDDVHLAVQDWKPMEKSVAETVDLMPGWAPGVKKSWMNECRQFMNWLLEDHFLLLGVRDYRMTGKGRSEKLEAVPGSGLGILGGKAQASSSRLVSSLPEAARKLSQKRPLIITKTNARSTVHRAGYLDYIGVLKINSDGKTVGERRYLGLFTSTAYYMNAMQTPMVRVRARNIMKKSDLVEGSHAWKTMVHILETLPRDELLQATSRQLKAIAEGVLNLQERKLVRLFIRKERYGRFYSCLVYLPREQFNTENREKIQAILGRALNGGRLDYNVSVAESRLARLQVLVRPLTSETVTPDVEALEQEITEAVRSWTDELQAILVEKYGEENGLRYFSRFGKSFPEAYKEDVSAWVAAFDVANAWAVDQGEGLRMGLYSPRDPRAGILRFKLFQKNLPIPLSNVLPILENLGLHIVNERPYELQLTGDESLWIQDFDMKPALDVDIDLDAVRDRFEEAFRRTVNGDADNDGFNRLVIGSQMRWRQVMALRAYCKYLQQANIPFSASYMADSMSSHPGMSRVLVELFEARFDPGREEESRERRDQAALNLKQLLNTIFTDDCQSDPVLQDYISDLIRARKGGRAGQVSAAHKLFQRGLQYVTSLDEDRILYAFYEVINATLRTSYYQFDEAGNPRDYISFKIDSQALPDLPRPRPFREIWVYSSRFEGVHLRGGMIARGGLRWSDRKEDFRTEVLGLMKAQSVKNTMIVPVGAKGGFVVKSTPMENTREAIFQEGVKCYTKFINGLLDITDNLDRDIVLPPEDVVRLDGDDPYLVVAADKGTATFSDTANAVAAEHGHWMGDAFASGGSVGYDHKGMGITARGAWEGVKRHFREMGHNIQKEPFTVVGIGDMGGDVFGNGMLLSRHIRLKAAFNHLHIFLDPAPDEALGYKERRRLFRKAGSSWLDYKPDLISNGGGVFSRADKTVAVSAEVRKWLGIEEAELAPNALIKKILKAEVDLLWNGGIGTYVKASSESHADVGDLANNSLRVNGSELRCKAVGEGGNLGMTQLGRVEFARNGGFVNTDFIDNSAGVDTSDHEVNIKILLNQAVRAGRLSADNRRELLAEMTDEVAAQVLRNTYLQTLAISMMESFSPSRLGSMSHFINVLEEAGDLDRELEFLPDDEELQRRRESGEGLCRPELAVLLSYSKITLFSQLLESDVPEDSWLSDEAVNYFPAAIRERYARYVPTHRLKREIIATQVTNSLVNRMGSTFVMRMQEDTGAAPGDVARAYSIAREIFNAREFWCAIEALDNKVDSSLQISAMLEMWGLMRQATRWLLNLPDGKLEIRRMVRRLAPGLEKLEEAIRESLTEEEKEVMEATSKPLLEGGFPRKLAERAAILAFLFPALDIVETAARRKTDPRRVARIAFGLGDVIEFNWLRRQISSLDVAGQWHAMSRANLRNELFAHENRLVERILNDHGRKKDPVQAWSEAHHLALERVVNMIVSMKSQPEMDYATLSVAVRALGKLVD